MTQLPIFDRAKDFPAKEAIYRYFGVSETGGVLRIILLLPDDPVRALADRLRTARRLFIRSLVKMKPKRKDVRTDPVRFEFDPAAKDDVRVVLDHLDTRLAAILEAPLPAKLVDGLLRITPKERRRWWKDGRLPPCGYRTSTRSSARFNLPVFAVELIESLRKNPQIIEQWRREDTLPQLHIEPPILETSSPGSDLKI